MEILPPSLPPPPRPPSACRVQITTLSSRGGKSPLMSVTEEGEACTKRDVGKEPDSVLIASGTAEVSPPFLQVFPLAPLSLSVTLFSVFFLLFFLHPPAIQSVLPRPGLLFHQLWGFKPLFPPIRALRQNVCGKQFFWGWWRTRGMSAGQK